MRPWQWVKNFLVYLPLIAAHKLYDAELLGRAAAAFAAFTLCAAGVYLLNDLLDLADDRRHPHKRSRPLAAGQVGIAAAAGLSLLLIAAALGTGFAIHPFVSETLAFYCLANLGYSIGLKNKPILDVLILAAGYAARLIAGGIAVHITLSAWLLAFCMFLFFSLALIKRYAELIVLHPRDGVSTHARGYLFDDLGIIAAQGIASGYIAVLVLALYTTTPMVHALRGRDPLYWLICLLLLYWISYLWLMVDRGRIGDDPVAFAIRDRTSQVLVAVAVLAALAVT